MVSHDVRTIVRNRRYTHSMAIEWNKVTWYSKLAAVAVFLATFLVAFNLGAIADKGGVCVPN